MITSSLQNYKLVYSQHNKMIHSLPSSAYFKTFNRWLNKSPKLHFTYKLFLEVFNKYTLKYKSNSEWMNMKINSCKYFIIDKICYII